MGSTTSWRTTHEPIVFVGYNITLVISVDIAPTKIPLIYHQGELTHKNDERG